MYEKRCLNVTQLVWVGFDDVRWVIILKDILKKLRVLGHYKNIGISS